MITQRLNNKNSQSDTNKDTLSYFIDYDYVVNQVANNKDLLFQMIEDDLSEQIKKMSPEETLSFKLLTNGRPFYRVNISATKQYAKTLYCFLKGKNYSEKGFYNNDYFPVESVITQPLINQVERTIENFYSHQKIMNCINTSILNSFNSNDIVKTAIKKGINNNSKELKNEIIKTICVQSTKEMRKQVMNQTVNQVINFLHTTLMTQVVASIGSVLSTKTAQYVIFKIGETISHSITSASIKIWISSLIKKIGVASIMKTAIGKALLAILSLFGLSVDAISIIIILSLLPIIVKYHYMQFPEKLAKSIPKDINKHLRDNFENINKTIIYNMLSNMSKELEQERIRRKKRKRYLTILLSISVICIILIFFFLFIIH